ncbi:glycosyltransferase family 2 protein [Niallia sp. NCCP-28]|uniref:glycosyltransferase family 2 protein n=1 Tax=Niallia sp. NCCP-28 TaxID=2934712 RepID=UPI0020859616|nr:glycosyltransferase family 2 protein [Niallia sp. NCCP-28]GKU80701.1 hypothetical protein NCCP28_00970 [Niallia sp. NCCP-28]
MHLDIIIVTYNSERFIKDCLESIMNYTPVSKSIYIVDNGSVDGTLPYLKSINDIYILENKGNLGYSAAVNRGIRAGTGDIIAIFNADTRVTEGWLEPLIQCLYSDPKVAVVGPKMINSNNQIVACGTSWDWSMPGFMDENRVGLLDEQRDCLVVNGACFLIKRENIPILGLLDENYFFYFEETDYCFNANSLGYRVVFCPKSLIYHEHDFSSRNKPHQVQFWAESEKFFNSKWRYDPFSRTIYKKF